MEAVVYNQTGDKVGTIDLPADVFGAPWNSDLVHQVVSSSKLNSRVAIAHTKTRGEVRGGGKKPWQQKGLGRARHGSIRSPIWVGGGVAHGPRNDKNFSRKINKKMNAKALYAVLTRKNRDGEILFIDNLVFSAPKTKDALGVLKSFSGLDGFKNILRKKTNSAYIATASKDKTLEKSFNNFKNIEVNEARNLNVLDILQYKYLIISNPEQALGQIAGKIKIK